MLFGLNSCNMLKYLSLIILQNVKHEKSTFVKELCNLILFVLLVHKPTHFCGFGYTSLN